MWAIPTDTSLALKKKPGKESQYMVSHPELRLDPPIGLEPESGLDKKHGILPLRLDSWFNCKVMEFGIEQTLTNPCVWFVYGL